MAKKNTGKDVKTAEEGDVLDDVLSDEEVETTQTTETTEDKDDKEVEAKEAKEEEAEEETVPETAPEPVTQAEEKPEVPKKDDKEEVPPPKPARPPTPRQQALKSLQEAFPTVEEKYIQSHLIASNYNLEQSFNALLYLSDPDSFNLDEVVPQAEASKNMAAVMEQPVPSLPQRRMTQMEEDELLAKSLDEEYRRKAERRTRRQGDMRRQRVAQGGEVDDEDDENILSNFVEKDLPQIKEQFSKNIEETKNKFNAWVGGWKKQYTTAQQELNNRQIKKQVRDEFDDEPQEVDLQKFHGIKLSDDTEEVKPKMPARSRAQSTDLYGTPKHKQEEGETKKTEETKSKKASGPADDDDDFLLSD